MRAVVWEGKPYEMAVRDVPRPTIEMPEDAIIRVTSTAICGSDLHTYHGILGAGSPPWTMGHEAVGVVVAVGSATEHFHVGDRVLIPGAPDLGYFALDDNAGTVPPYYGQGTDNGGLGGCQGKLVQITTKERRDMLTENAGIAEYVRVPYADDSLILIPDQYSSDLDWLYLSDIFVTAWDGLDLAKFQSGDEVAVFGAGPVGLVCVYVAMLRGASRVFSIDHIQDRLDKAASLGATPINFTSEEGTASEQILRRLPNGVARVVDCVGQFCLNHRLRPEQNYVVQEAIRVASFNGGISLTGGYIAMPSSAGAPNGDTMEENLLVALPLAFQKALTIGTGSVGYNLYQLLPRLYELVRSGRARFDFLSPTIMSIEDAPLAYERFEKKLETKIVFRFAWGGQVAATEGLSGDKRIAPATERIRFP